MNDMFAFWLAVYVIGFILMTVMVVFVDREIAHAEKETDQVVSLRKRLTGNIMMALTVVAWPVFFLASPWLLKRAQRIANGDDNGN